MQSAESKGSSVHVSDLDADLFLVGLKTEEEASRLLGSLMKVFPASSTLFMRSAFCITVKANDCNLYQFVLRLFERPDQVRCCAFVFVFFLLCSSFQVLGGFDLPAASVGFSPTTVSKQQHAAF